MDNLKQIVYENNKVGSEAPLMSLVLILGVENVSFSTFVGMGLNCLIPTVDGGLFNIFPSMEPGEDGATNDVFEKQKMTATTVEEFKLIEIGKDPHTNNPLFKTEKRIVETEEPVVDRSTLLNTIDYKSLDVEMIENTRLEIMNHGGLQRSPLHPYHTQMTRGSRMKNLGSGEMTATPDQTDTIVSLNGPWDYFVEYLEQDLPYIAKRDLKDKSRMQESLFKEENLMPFGKIRVPYAAQSKISGIGSKIAAEERVWYQKSGVQMPIRTAGMSLVGTRFSLFNRIR